MDLLARKRWFSAPRFPLSDRRAIYERATRNAINGYRHHRRNCTACRLGNRYAARRSRLDSPAPDDRRVDAHLAHRRARRPRTPDAKKVIPLAALAANRIRSRRAVRAAPTPLTES